MPHPGLSLEHTSSATRGGLQAQVMRQAIPGDTRQTTERCRHLLVAAVGNLSQYPGTRLDLSCKLDL